MSHYLQELRPKARLRHACFVCDCSIWPGTRYVKSSFVMDGSAYTIKEHEECRRVALDIFDPWDDEGYDGEYIRESLYEAYQIPYDNNPWGINRYAVGDMTRDERVVFGRMRQRDARIEIRRALAR